MHWWSRYFKQQGPFQAWAMSQRGKREENQDNYLVVANQQACHLEQQTAKIQPIDWSADYMRIAVADGLGGHTGGRIMAERVIQGLMQIPPQKTVKSMKKAILKLHDGLLPKQSTEHSPGSTLVMADIHQRTGRGVLVNIGDSRAYLYRQGSWRCLTFDQHIAEFNWRDGLLEDSGYQAALQMNLPLVQALGYGSQGIITDVHGYRPNQRADALRLDLPTKKALHGDIFCFSLQAEDGLLFSSDGLWDPVEDGVWNGVDPTTLCSDVGLSALAEKTIAAGGSDNITLLFCVGNAPLSAYEKTILTTRM